MLRQPPGTSGFCIAAIAAINSGQTNIFPGHIGPQQIGGTTPIIQNRRRKLRHPAFKVLNHCPAPFLYCFHCKGWS